MKHLIFLSAACLWLLLPLVSRAQISNPSTARLYNPNQFSRTSDLQLIENSVEKRPSSVMFRNREKSIEQYNVFYREKERKRNHGGGAFIGALGGLVVGLVAAELLVPECESDFLCFRGLSVVSIGILGGIAGGVTGGIIGLPRSVDEQK